MKQSLSFANYLKKNPGLCRYSAFLGILIYGYKLFNLNFGMDTHEQIVNFSGNLRHWLSIGRPGLVLIKKILMGSFTNLYLLNLLGALLLVISALLICYMCYLSLSTAYSGKKMYLFPSIYLTSQLFIYQFYFVLQSFEFSLGIILTVSSILLIQKQPFTFKSKLAAVLLLGFSISIYQSFLFFFIALSAAVTLLIFYVKQNQQETFPFKDLITLTKDYVLVCLLSLLLYFIVNYLVKLLLNIESSGYLLDQSLWGTATFPEALYSLIRATGGILFFNFLNPIYNYAFTVGLIGMLVLLYRLVKAQSSWLPLFVSMIVLFSSGLAMVFITAKIPPAPRSMVPAYSFVAAFSLFYLSLFCSAKKTRYLLLFFITLFTCQQTMTSTNLIFSDQMKFEEDQRRMDRIITQIDSLYLVNASKYKLILLGTTSTQNQLNITSDVLGFSMFEFGGPYNVNTNILKMMAANGTVYQVPTFEEYQNFSEDPTIKNRLAESSKPIVQGQIIILDLANF